MRVSKSEWSPGGQCALELRPLQCPSIPSFSQQFSSLEAAIDDTERLCAFVGEVADGFFAHPFTTRKSLLENTLPIEADRDVEEVGPQKLRRSEDEHVDHRCERKWIDGGDGTAQYQQGVPNAASIPASGNPGCVESGDEVDSVELK